MSNLWLKSSYDLTPPRNSAGCKKWGRAAPFFEGVILLSLLLQIFAVESDQKLNINKPHLTIIS